MSHTFFRALPWKKHYGHGNDAVLDYPSRYVFRIAIGNARIIGMDDTHVTFRYKDRDAEIWRTMRLPGVELLRRFLQHVLPRGFHKVRYYGLWHHSKRDLSSRAWLLLILQKPTEQKTRTQPNKTIALTNPAPTTPPTQPSTLPLPRPSTSSNQAFLIGSAMRKALSIGHGFTSALGDVNFGLQTLLNRDSTASFPRLSHWRTPLHRR